MKGTEDVAKEAYLAYGSVTGMKNYQGLPMPQWEDLPENIRDAWCVAVQKVLEYRDEPLWDA